MDISTRQMLLRKVSLNFQVLKRGVTSGKQNQRRNKEVTTMKEANGELSVSFKYQIKATW